MQGADANATCGETHCAAGALCVARSCPKPSRAPPPPPACWWPLRCCPAPPHPRSHARDSLPVSRMHSSCWGTSTKQVGPSLCATDGDSGLAHVVRFDCRQRSRVGQDKGVGAASTGVRGWQSDLRQVEGQPGAAGRSSQWCRKWAGIRVGRRCECSGTTAAFCSTLGVAARRNLRNASLHLSSVRLTHHPQSSWMGDVQSLHHRYTLQLAGALQCALPQLGCPLAH